jgi:hypothetical protein
MGYGLDYFIAEDNEGLTRVPAVKCHRWLADDEAVPAERAWRAPDLQPPSRRGSRRSRSASPSMLQSP